MGEALIPRARRAAQARVTLAIRRNVERPFGEGPNVREDALDTHAEANGVHAIDVEAEAFDASDALCCAERSRAPILDAFGERPGIVEQVPDVQVHTERDRVLGVRGLCQVERALA